MELAAEGEHCGRGSNYRRSVAAHELTGAIADGILLRPYGRSDQVSMNVVGEMLHRCVAPLRFLAEGHQQDCIEVAAQLHSQFVGRAFRDFRSFAVETRRDNARTFRNRFEHGALESQFLIAMAQRMLGRRVIHRGALRAHKHP